MIIKPHIVAMSAYKPPIEGRDPHKNLLLDFNEKTLPISEKVQQALIEYIQSERLQMYPAYAHIVPLIADYANVDAQQLMITNGSDQGIELVFRSVCAMGDEVIIPSPSFAMYSQCAKIENAKIVSPFYSFENGYPITEVLKSITQKTRIIVVSNPNNPCGTLTSKETIIRLAKAAPHAAILVDECYYEYSNATVSDLVGEYSNIIITRTFSKTWGIPSLRFGYIISAKENIKALLNVRGPYDVNQLAVVAVKAALNDFSNVKDYVQEVMNVSKPLLENYLTKKNISFWPSQANYLWAFFSAPNKIQSGLEAQNILVRPKIDANGKTGLRITLGTQEQTQKLISVLDTLLLTLMR